MQIEGKKIKCDRCGLETFVEKQKELFTDRGFTRNRITERRQHMSCEHCENEFNFNPEEDIIVDAGGAVRSVLMDIGDALLDICKGLELDEIKINVSRDCDTGDMVFKAKVDGYKVLEIKANDFVPYYAD